MTPELNYEHFIRMAFSHALNKEVDRYGDPASLANTDLFTQDNICEVKAGLAYAMHIYSNEIQISKELSEKEYQRIDNFICRIINASSLKEIHDIKVEFETTVIDNYYTINDGKRTLK
ncbi:MAG TPA: hypothetical protein VKA34_20705 [Balneolales bacterium]|nr:hypothetical protein [Balneolales bacterium]